MFINKLISRLLSLRRRRNRVDNPDMTFSTEGYSPDPTVFPLEVGKRLEFRDASGNLSGLEGGIWDNTTPCVRGGDAGGGKTQRQRDEGYTGLGRSMTVTVDRVPDWLESGDVVVQRSRRTYAQALNRTEPRYRAILRRLRRFFK